MLHNNIGQVVHTYVPLYNFVVVVLELVYDDVFVVWEMIWVAKHVSSPHFVLFIALALVEYYRGIIIDNSMDFTDIIKFFNGISPSQSHRYLI